MLKITFATEMWASKAMHSSTSDAVADADGCRAGLAMGLPGRRGWEMLGGAGSRLVFPKNGGVGRAVEQGTSNGHGTMCSTAC